MVDSKLEKKPFWVSTDEVKGIRDSQLGGAIGKELAGAVPTFKRVQKGRLIAEYGIKDNLLIYHFYKQDRKEIFDAAHEAIDQATQTHDRKTATALISKISAQANHDLEQRPWWPRFKEIVSQEFDKHFRYQRHKLDYYPEVDSWSLILPVPTISAQEKPQFQEAFISRISLLLGSS